MKMPTVKVGEGSIGGPTTVRKLGRIQPVTRPRVQLAALVHPKPAQEPPTEVDRSEPQLKLSMFGNGPDPTVTNAAIAAHGVGDCVIAAILNKIRHARCQLGLTIPDFTGDEALALYSAITGFDPLQVQPDGSNPTDQGAEPNLAFTYWQTHGVPLPEGGVHKIGGFVGVNPLDDRQWKIGLLEFDALLTGYALPRTIEGQGEEWTVTDPTLQGDAEPGSLGGHEILTESYSPPGVGDWTWAERKRASDGFKRAYCDQLTAIISPEDLNKEGVSDTGLDYSALKTAFEGLGSL